MKNYDDQEIFWVRTKACYSNCMSTGIINKQTNSSNTIYTFECFKILPEYLENLQFLINILLFHQTRNCQFIVMLLYIYILLYIVMLYCLLLKPSFAMILSLFFTLGFV